MSTYSALKGSVGPVGATGYVGTTGATGYQGTTGATGYQGATGIGTRVTTIADGTSISINADTTDTAVQTNTQTAGTLTINAPTGTITNGQRLIIRLQSTNVQTFSWNAVFAGSNDLTLPTASTGSGKYDYIGFQYNSVALKWQLLAKNFGF